MALFQRILQNTDPAPDRDDKRHPGKLAEILRCHMEGISYVTGEFTDGQAFLARINTHYSGDKVVIGKEVSVLYGNKEKLGGGLFLLSEDAPVTGELIAAVLSAKDSPSLDETLTEQQRVDGYAIRVCDGLMSAVRFKAPDNLMPLCRLFGLVVDNEVSGAASYFGELLCDRIAAHHYPELKAPLIEGFRAAVAKSASELDQRRLSKLVDRFRDKINMDVIAILKASASWDCFDYSDYAGYAPEMETAEEKAEAERRTLWLRQAAQAYPPLAGKFTAPEGRAVRDAIVKGEKLDQKLESLTGLQKATLKAMRKIQWPIPAELSEKHIFAVMRDLPPDWLTKGGKQPGLIKTEWDSFCVLAHLARETALKTGQSALKLIEPSKGNFDDYLHRIINKLLLASDPPGEHPNERLTRLEMLKRVRTDRSVQFNVLMGAVNEIEMAHDAFTREVVMPIAAYAVLERGRIGGMDKIVFNGTQMELIQSQANDILFSERSLLDIVEQTQKIGYRVDLLDQMRAAGIILPDDDIRAIVGDELVMNPPIHTGWSAMTGVVTAPNGLTIVPLTNMQMFRDESKGCQHGSAMNNCVGNGEYYADKCAFLGAHIFSVRAYEANGTFQRIATVETTPITTVDGFEHILTNQRRGKCNTRIPEDADQATNWYLDSIMTGVLPVDKEGIIAALAERKTRQNDYKQQRRQQRTLEAEAERQLAILRNFRKHPVTSVCRYDWRNAEHLQRAITGWNRPFQTINNNEVPAILGGKWRHATLETFMDLDGVKNVVGIANPYAREAKVEMTGPGTGM